MKILLVNDYGTPTGGAELQMLGLRDRLRELGHDARLFTSRASLTPGELLADAHCFGAQGRVQVLSQTANPSAYLGLRRILRRFRPDVVHVRMFLWQLSPLILPLLRNVPSLYQAAVYKAICPTGLKLLPDGHPCEDPAGQACLLHGCLTPQTWAALMLQMKLFRRWRSAFDLTVALSHTMAARLEAAGLGPVEVVHNGVQERPARPRLADPPTVAYAGRLAPEKGIDVLLRAFALVRRRVPQADLLVAGNGPERDRLQRLAASLGLGPDAVTFLGHLPRAELERRFDPAWVQVVPSLWDEPFGNVTTEAMARGTAVVASAVGAQPEIVRHNETGFLVPPGDPDALAEALLRVLGEQPLAERLGHAGRRIALAEFSQAKVVERFLAIYEDLSRRRAPICGTSNATGPEFRRWG